MAKVSRVVGKILRVNNKALVVVKVDGKYYLAAAENADLLESYLHTGDEFYLMGLTNALEI